MLFLVQIKIRPTSLDFTRHNLTAGLFFYTNCILSELFEWNWPFGEIPIFWYFIQLQNLSNVNNSQYKVLLFFIRLAPAKRHIHCLSATLYFHQDLIHIISIIWYKKTTLMKGVIWIIYFYKFFLDWGIKIVLELLKCSYWYYLKLL